MKRKLMITLSLLMTAVLLLSLPIATAKTTPVATAEQELLFIGDVDEDNDVTIVDATIIQRRLAGLRELDELGEFLGDTDGDRELTILDATLIQRRVADLADDFWSNTIVRSVPEMPYYTLRTYYPLHTSTANPVYADTPVTLQYHSRNFANGKIIIRNRYDVFVDDRQIVKDDKQLSCSYRFESAGEHTVKIIARNTFGESEARAFSVTVVDSPDKPYLADGHFDRETNLLSIQAAGGSGGYQYCYYIRLTVPEPPTEDATDGDGPSIPPTQPPTFRPEPMEEGTYQLTTNYIDSPNLEIPAEMLNSGMDYKFYVQIKDSAGNESDMTRVYIYYDYY